jgi:hypothetical protein
MAQQAHSRGSAGKRRYRTGIGGAWWAALAVVTVALGLLGRSGSGFWSVFLWSIVGFVAGSLVSIAVAGRVVPARSEQEAVAGPGADLAGSDGTGAAR